MTASLLGNSSEKASQIPADARLLEQRRRAGLAHQLVKASAGRAERRVGPAVEHAFADQLHPPEKVTAARKSEFVPCATIGSLKRALSSDALRLLDAAWNAAQAAGPGVGIACSPSDAAQLLGSLEAGRAAQSELIAKGVLRPNIVGALSYQDGYRVVLP